jgi:L-seryl-tRNA(Ser) seleniumtransferase
VLVDAASQVYPLDVFRSFTKLGCDLVCFGAKYLGAAQSSGILCGKKDLVAAAVLQGFIGFEQSAANKAFGRPLKLDRQEIVGVVTALREWMTMDHTLRIAELERKLTVIGHPLEGLPGVKLHYLQGGGAGPRVLRVTIEPGVAKKSAAEVIAGLRQGNPAISVGAEPHALLINPSTIQRGDEEIVAQRLQTLLA